MTTVSPRSRDHYFADEPAVTSRPDTIRLDLADLSLSLRTDRGVFSATRVDPGTKLLLMELPPAADWPEGVVVDVGCGYGPIAVTLARRSPEREVWAVDVNARARELTSANAAAAGVEIKVSSPDEVPDSLRVVSWCPTRRSGSARRPCTTCSGRGWDACRTRERRGWWCRSTSAPIPWPPGSPIGVTASSGCGHVRATASSAAP